MTTTIRRAIAALCALVAVFGGAASTLGVFARGDGTFAQVISARGEVYEIATSGVYANNARQLVAEGVGWDVFTLAVAVPLLLVGAWLVARGSFRGSLVAAGMLGYFTYMYLEYAITWAFGPLFGLFIAIYAVSLVGLVGLGAIVAADGVRERFSTAFPRRSWAVLSIGMAALLAVAWIGRIADALAAGTPALHGETTMTVQALDLGLVVPAAVLLPLLALRRNQAARAASTAFAITFVTMSAAIASMMVSSWLVTGVLEPAPIVTFSAAALAGLWVVMRMLASIGPAPTGIVPTAAPGSTLAELPADAMGA